jgi:hypothetical protein
MRGTKVLMYVDDDWWFPIRKWRYFGNFLVALSQLSYARRVSMGNGWGMPTIPISVTTRNLK